jgi:hypothetical protein
MSNYLLDDYNKITFDGFNYVLPDTILTIISNLTKEIETTYASQNVTTNSSDTKYRQNNHYNKRGKPNNLNNKKVSTVTDEEWQSIKTFKSTKMEKKEGIEKSINDIRICLNKLSNKNYEVQTSSIIELIQSIIDNDEEEDIKTVAKSIFDIASNNKFYSEIYANLYKDLMERYGIFKENIGNFIEKYKESIDEINYIDPNTDYDKFCDYNKSNDSRKALSTFIVNMMKNGILKTTTITDIILFFQNRVFEYIELPNKSNEVEEITENIFILVTLSKMDCNECGEWKTITENLKQISQLKSKDKLSLSNRALFKYMDILDQLKKK